MPQGMSPGNVTESESCFAPVASTKIIFAEGNERTRIAKGNETAGGKEKS
jgi:hypothetical protein